MRVLVTGANGFVGTHLCRGLRDYGCTVIETDKADAPLDEEGMATAVVRLADPDYVVHLAARYGRILCRDEPHLAVQDNAAATTELAAVCAEKDIPVLYASSSEVYGDHGTDWITEESELRTPTTIYGLSKRWGEEALSLYLPPEKLCIVRANMLFGISQLGGYGRCSLATFIQNTVEGKPFVVHRDSTRSWLYISDAVRALCELIDWRLWGTFNLGNPTPPISMIEVADMVGGEYEVADAPANQIRNKNYDCTKLLNAIDWEPEVSVEDGIRRTLAWAQGVYAVPKAQAA